MPFALRYIALYVPDVHAAEDFFGSVFAMALLFRESEQADGTSSTLRPEIDWGAAETAHTGIDMVALRRDEFVLALFRGAPAPGTVFELCVGLPADEVSAVRERLPQAGLVIESRPDSFGFEDPFGFRWAVQREDAEFRSSGDIAGRWINRTR